MGSFNGRVYTYQYNGNLFAKDYENLNYPGSAIRRVYWLPTSAYDGYFNTWGSSSSNGTFYVFKRDLPVGVINSQIPLAFKLYQNYPNPFNPATKLRFEIAELRFVSVKVFDVLGKEIQTMIYENLSPGTYEIKWDGTNFGSGVYFYSLATENYSETKKMLLIK